MKERKERRNDEEHTENPCCALSGAAAGWLHESGLAGYTQVSSEKAAQLMEDYDDEIVLDVRTPENTRKRTFLARSTCRMRRLAKSRSQSCRIRIRSSSFTAAAAIAARRLRKSWQIRAIRMSSNLAASKIGTVRPWLHKTTQAHAGILAWACLHFSGDGTIECTKEASQ